jgi:protein-S-isoprenylcysteine O-methyltransferase Ste14
MKRLARWAFGTLFVALVLMLSAGTWRDPWLWSYVAVASAIAFLALVTIDEDLARERFTPPNDGADRLSLRVIRIIALAHLVVGAADSGRFHWTTMAPELRIIGLVGFALSFLIVFRAMATNRFFSAVVRVQTDRGHRVVDSGPYRLVRHPGYAGMITAVPFSALALGSWPSMVLALLYSALILRRVAFEDRFLHANLDGYADYATRVRYRLIPGAW